MHPTYLYSDVAQLALWTAGIVVLTLVINAPMIPKLVEWTGLAEISPVKVRIRAKAIRALERYTQAAIHDLQHDEDEMLRGRVGRGFPGLLRSCGLQSEQSERY